MTKMLDWLFGQPEEINGHQRCPTYLFRWKVIKKRPSGFAVYIHRFVGDDWSLDVHDHPKRFITIGFYGAYLETYETLDGKRGQRWYRAPWIRTFPATHRHRIQTPSQSCWTLVITLPASRDWGFWPEGKFVQWERYVNERGGRADRMKSCE